MFRVVSLQELNTFIEHTEKMLLQFVHSRAVLKSLPYKEIYRKSGQYGLIGVEQIEQWLLFHKNRCTPGTEIGERFVQEPQPLFTQIRAKSYKTLLLIEEHNKKVEPDGND